MKKRTVPFFLASTAGELALLCCFTFLPRSVIGNAAFFLLLFYPSLILGLIPPLFKGERVLYKAGLSLATSLLLGLLQLVFGFAVTDAGGTAFMLLLSLVFVALPAVTVLLIYAAIGVLHRRGRQETVTE